MRKAEMAIVYPTAGMSGSNDEVRLNIWSQTAALLKPHLGKLYDRFEAADSAWDEKIGSPYGVILGKDSPEQFLYFYSVGKKLQSRAVDYHLRGFLGSMDIIDKSEDAERGFTMSPKARAEDAVAAHAFWHVGMMSGELFPDAGIYFAAARQAVIGDKLHQEIMKNIGDYAIAMVRFYDLPGKEAAE